MPSRFIVSASSGTTSAVDVAHRDAVDLDAVEPHRRGLADAVGGLHLDGVVARPRKDAELGRGGFAERDRDGAGIDDEVDGAAIDPRLDLEMPRPLSLKVTVR